MCFHKGGSMHIEIRVVDVDGELLFEDKPSGLRFDVLAAFDGFEGGKLVIRRDGKVVAETRRIAEYGTHAACTCFIGLDGIFGESSSLGYASSTIGASACRPGDELILDVPPEGREINFAEALRDDYRGRCALDAVFKSHGGQVTSTKQKNAFDIIRDGMAAAMPTIGVPEVLRFRKR